MMYCITDPSHGAAEKIGWKRSKDYPKCVVLINRCPICKEQWPEGYLGLLEAALAGSYGPNLE